MPDYKKMYLCLLHATEEAIDTLIAAQRECEEWYLTQEADPPKAIRLEQIRRE